MKEKRNLNNVDKLILNKLKIAKLENLISIKGGGILSDDPPETDNDTWGS